MRKTSKRMAFSFACVLASQPASAGFADIPVQMKILLENINQTLHLGEILKWTRETMRFAADTSDAARAAVSIVPTIQDPAFWSLNNRIMERKLRRSFPNLADVAQDARFIKGNGRSIAKGGDYDPYAIYDLWDYQGNLRSNTYELLSYMNDDQSVTKEHKETAQDLKENAKVADAISKEIDRLGGMTAQQAAGKAAKAGGITAKSTTSTALATNEMLRIMKSEKVGRAKSQAKADKILKREVDFLNGLHHSRKKKTGSGAKP